MASLFLFWIEYILPAYLVTFIGLVVLEATGMTSKMFVMKSYLALLGLVLLVPAVVALWGNLYGYEHVTRVPYESLLVKFFQEGTNIMEYMKVLMCLILLSFWIMVFCIHGAIVLSNEKWSAAGTKKL